MEGKTVSVVQKERFFAEGNDLPECINHGCHNKVSVRSWLTWNFKIECSTCLRKRLNGEKREGITYIKKTYCENHDGRLGFACPSEKHKWKGFPSVVLDLDHIDGNHHNNDPNNIQTLCKVCHSRKTLESGDCSNQKASARRPSTTINMVNDKEKP